MNFYLFSDLAPFSVSDKTHQELKLLANRESPLKWTEILVRKLLVA
jgi:hypothetical protein